MIRYLFTYFMDEQEDGEKVYFAGSEDGLFWKEMNGGKPVLTSQRGTKGARDPFPVRNPKTGKIYVIATDLNMAENGDWNRAKTQGSTGFLMWESDDLEHWSEAMICPVNIEQCGCVWAPEAIYDEEKEKFFVYFSCWTENKITGKGKHKIYACYTEDFKEFTSPFVYIERLEDVIDTTIVKVNEKYFRVSKNENTEKLIFEVGDNLVGYFKEISFREFEKIQGIEGPELYPLLDGTWCLLADHYREHRGYHPIIIEEMEKGVCRIPEQSEYNMGTNKKRHGGILKIF